MYVYREKSGHGESSAMVGNTISEGGKAASIKRATRWMFRPFVAPMIEERQIALIMAAVVVLQVGFTAAGITVWRCPIKAFSGISCPGCGLSRAMVQLVSGDWRSAMITHAFAPVFLIGLVLAAIGSLLPDRLHRKTVNTLTVLEQDTGFVAFLLVGSVLYKGGTSYNPSVKHKVYVFHKLNIFNSVRIVKRNIAHCC